jgi:hypothetical protein
MDVLIRSYLLAEMGCDVKGELLRILQRNLSQCTEALGLEGYLLDGWICG